MTSETTGGLAETIRNFVRTRFPVARNLEIADADSLLDANVIDSLGILDLVAFLEQEFGIAVGDDDLVPENFESIDALVAFVTSRR